MSRIDELADSPEQNCDNCGASNVPLTSVEGYDRCPTDRGDEVRYYTLYLCEECVERMAA